MDYSVNNAARLYSAEEIDDLQSLKDKNVGPCRLLESKDDKIKELNRD